MNMIKIISKEQIKEAEIKYNSYGSDFKHEYFNIENGGYLVINKKRIAQGEINKQEQRKYEKEYSMCMTLSHNGYRVEFLEFKEGCFDIYLNGIAADLKKTSGTGNIEKYAKKAIRDQGAELVVFEFSKEKESIYAEIENLKKLGLHGKYYFTDKCLSIYEF